MRWTCRRGIWEARRGRSLLSRSGAFPEIGVSVVIVVVHRPRSSSCHVDFSPPPRAPALQSREREQQRHCRISGPLAGIQKAPVTLVDEGYTPYRGTTTVCPAKGPLPVRRAIRQTDRRALTGASRGRLLRIRRPALGCHAGGWRRLFQPWRFAFVCRSGSRSLSRLALSLNPHHSQLILCNAHAV